MPNLTLIVSSIAVRCPKGACASGFAGLAGALLLAMSCLSRPAETPTATELEAPPMSLTSETYSLHQAPKAEVDVASRSTPHDDGGGERAELEVAPLAPHPLEGLSGEQIKTQLRETPEALGSMSVGEPNGGALFNAVQLPEDPRWERVDASHAWGTQETVDYITAAIATVHARFDDTPPLPIGHISARRGGPLSPHRSHQSGRDVDLGFYYQPDAHSWYRRATKANLDLPRTWALVRALVTETDVRLILVDHSIQTFLRNYARSIGEDEVWLQDVFDGGGPTRPAIIRHAPGHATHLHVRFYNPIAQESARRSYAALIALGKVKAPVHYVQHRVRKGDTLIGLAKRYGTTVAAIKRANGLRSNLIMAKRTYKIPRQGPAAAGPVSPVPPRRLPPDASGSSVSQYRRAP